MLSIIVQYDKLILRNMSPKYVETRLPAVGTVFAKRITATTVRSTALTTDIAVSTSTS